MTTYRRLILLALMLTTLVVVFGAYVRLSDAGLGCPDWPGCYGQLSPHHAANDILQSHAADPHGPVSLSKAWKEMIHRYLAACLGFLILAIAILAWRHRATPGAAPWGASVLVGIVAMQGLLGKLTVTLLLKPAIVTAHLIGGLTTLAVLVLIALRAHRVTRIDARRGTNLLARLGLILVAAQVTLGGWTSTNYAALACPDFPSCHGSLWPAADYANAFHVVRELGMTADGNALPFTALTAIHWSHRLGALLTAAALFALSCALIYRQRTRLGGLILLGAVALQIALGVANVVLSLPLPLAVAHNAGAVVLVGLMVWINYRLRGARAASATMQGRAGHVGHQDAYA